MWPTLTKGDNRLYDITHQVISTEAIMEPDDQPSYTKGYHKSVMWAAIQMWLKEYIGDIRREIYSDIKKQGLRIDLTAQTVTTTREST
jgi:hypothetical protein